VSGAGVLVREGNCDTRRGYSPYLESVKLGGQVWICELFTSEYAGYPPTPPPIELVTGCPCLLGGQTTAGSARSQHCRSHIVAPGGAGVCDSTHWSFVMYKESSSRPLIPENVLDLRIQIMSSLIDEFEIASVYLSPLHSRF